MILELMRAEFSRFWRYFETYLGKMEIKAIEKEKNHVVDKEVKKIEKVKKEYFEEKNTNVVQGLQSIKENSVCLSYFISFLS